MTRPAIPDPTAAGARQCLLAAGAAALGLLLLPTPVGAHEAFDAAGGFVSGFGHPLRGLDHLIAMVAVGLWGALLGAPALWLLPVAFPLMMAVGGVLGIAGVALPAVETGIAVSGVVLGAAVAAAWRPPLVVAAVIVAVFALLHGHAHGTELPSSASPLAYSLGFVLATGLLHVAGIGIGAAARGPSGRIAVRLLGAVIAVTGAVFLIRAG